MKPIIPIGIPLNRTGSGRAALPVLALLFAAVLLVAVANSPPVRAATGNQPTATATETTLTPGIESGTASYMAQGVNDQANLVLTPNTLTIDEDDTGTFTVKLASAPTADVTVSVKSSRTGTATAVPASVSFTPTDWQSARTVTVTTHHDIDNRNESVNINLSASGGEYEGKTGIVGVSVLDDETAAPGLVIDPPRVVAGEDRNFPVTVKLATQPTGPVTVRATGSGTQLVLSEPSLQFNEDTWNDGQTFWAWPWPDNDHDNDDGKLTLTASGGGYDGETGEVSVNVIDDEPYPPRLVINPDRLNLQEGDQGSFAVSLARDPNVEMTVQVRVYDTHLATMGTHPLSYVTLTFTSDNWQDPQTVTLNAREEDNAARDFLSVSLFAYGEGLDSQWGFVSVVIDDNDAPGIVLNQETLSVEEEGIGAVSVKLAERPSGRVTIDLNSGDPDIATVSPASLTFTTNNWHRPKSVTVSGAADGNALNDRTNVSLVVSASNDDYSGVSAQLPVTVRDNDPKIRVSFSSGRYDATEGGDPATVVVQLSRANSEDVAIPIRLFVPGPSTRESDYSEVPESVTIAAGQSSGSFTITAIDDIVSDEDQNRLILRLREIPRGFVAGNPVRTTVSLIDNDESTGPPILTIHEASAVEGDDLVFRIDIQRPTDNHVTMFGWTKDITATKYQDYRYPRPDIGLRLQVGLGLTSAEVRLPTVEDSVAESTETFEVGINRISTYHIGGSQTVIGTIFDDD